MKSASTRRIITYVANQMKIRVRSLSLNRNMADAMLYAIAISKGTGSGRKVINPGASERREKGTADRNSVRYLLYFGVRLYHMKPLWSRDTRMLNVQ